MMLLRMWRERQCVCPRSLYRFSAPLLKTPYSRATLRTGHGQEASQSAIGESLTGRPETSNTKECLPAGALA